MRHGFGGSAAGSRGGSSRFGGSAVGGRSGSTGIGSGAAGDRRGSAGFGGGSAGGLGSRGPGGSAGGGDRFSAPSRNQLNSFLGLPSDGGLGGLGSARPSRGDNFDVNRGTATGPRGGQAAGAAVTGPRGNTAGKAVGIGAERGVAKAEGVRGADGGAAGRGAVAGPNGGVAAGGAVRGPEGGAAARGAAVGPGGRAAAGAAVRGPAGGAAARGVAVGSAGAAAGFARVTPSGRYTSATAVRANYRHWDVYGARWHTDHPGAWFAAGWAAGTAWRTATWSSYGAWMGYPVTTPIYYDYGNNITYEGDTVYVNGESVGTSQEYYEQASELAQTGVQADAPDDGEWMPLGVFALTKTGGTDSVVTIELAVNKESVIRGNYTDTKTDKTQLIQGSVDNETQRVAFTVGDNASNLIETGIYNLTKDEAPALVHIGSEKTEQWLLVRLKQDADAEASQAPA